MKTSNAIERIASSVSGQPFTPIEAEISRRVCGTARRLNAGMALSPVSLPKPRLSLVPTMTPDRRMACGNGVRQAWENWLTRPRNWNVVGVDRMPFMFQTGAAPNAAEVAVADQVETATWELL